MTEGWGRSIDVLLVFVILTTFIIQAYQFIAPAASDTTNAILLEILALQSNNSRLAASLVQPSAPPRRQIYVVNGVWFSALAFSLSTALFAMLTKQWLESYIPTTSGSPRHRARQRQERYLNLQAWHVPEIVNALPVLLHVALLLFFGGLLVLLWSTNLAITLLTWVIVALAYAFYIASIALPLVYPDCPYKHTVTETLRAWIFPDELAPKPISIRSYPRDTEKRNEYDARACTCIFEDVIDATALAWLFTQSTDQQIVSIALQAIAGLPRDFTALSILRDAGALALIEQGFQACFHKDTTIDLRWHLVDAESAALFCRAWIRLTRGTGEQWPLAIIEPLWLLQDLDLAEHADAAAIASCAIALSSFDSHVSQWEVLVHLARSAAGEVTLSQSTQCCLLDSISECFVHWEMPAAVIEDTISRVIPVLLRVLHLTEELPNSSVRSAAALALYIVTCGGKVAIDLGAYMNEEARRSEYCELMLQALSVIVRTPARFGVQDELLDTVSLELARVASPVVAQSERFPHKLRIMARESLSKLYADGRIGQGIVPDNVLADVLQLMFPPVRLDGPQKIVFVTTLVETLETTSHPAIINWAVRLLEILLGGCSLNVSSAFVECGGIEVVVRMARRDDSRRLQIDSLRTLCNFIGSVTDSDAAPETLDPLFGSDFFETLCAVVAARRWWLPEVTKHWLPPLVRLCRMRPQFTQVWIGVTKVFREYAERNVSEEGHWETLVDLQAMIAYISVIR
ncbi:hypothetical protein HMN09_00757100 [Mycena chlorophos]|uniref:DUF6535 domain-containing protein n=1 Tax=Mycena chlorophos TaxID=658473 RepID=A0A8H6SY25_MYCCL|nr:hypothetical protein HMN09_00757100 [Mycena chlorophos]